MISIIIPTYKNKDLLISNLKRNLEFFEGCEIIVVNDYPQETLQKTFSAFKNIHLIENKENLGFAGAVNVGVAKAKGNYVFLLNNDVLLNNDNFKKTILEFEKDPKLFAVSFAQREKDGRIAGANKIFWSRGLLMHKADNSTIKKINSWAEGGAAIFDKTKFMELGGFDKIYAPFYWEDIDLSYRAWKNGYRILFNPEVVVNHCHETTIGKYFTKASVKKIAFRNQFIFMFKNIDEPKLFGQFLILLVPNLIFLMIKGELSSVAGIIEALAKLGAIRKTRKAQKTSPILSDSQVLNLFHE